MEDIMTEAPGWAGFRSDADIGSWGITPTQALEVYREAWQDGGPTQEAIAAQYGISRAAVNTIKHGRAWGHTTGHGA